jgi:hypothetical protein
MRSFLLLSCAIASGCDGDARAGRAEDASELDASRDAETKAPFADQQLVDRGRDTASRDCHAWRFTLEADASLCDFPIPEKIDNPGVVDVTVPVEGGIQYLEPGTQTICNEGRWYWTWTEPDVGSVTLCDEACRSLREAGTSSLNVTIYCPRPPPDR